MSPLHDEDLPELFQLPLDRFTGARNELAARLRSTGSGDAAAAVKTLPKPPASAWAVNQVYWRARPDFDALLRAGARLKDAQRRGVSGNDLREAIREQRTAVLAAVKRAEEALQSAGHAVSPAVLRRMASTLEALAAGAEGARPGLLTGDLEPPGFDALGGLLPLPPPPEGPAATKAGAAPGEPRAGAEREARAAAEAARHARLVQEAETSLAEARQRLEGARGELLEAQRRFDRARERVDLSAAAVDEAEARWKQADAQANASREQS